MALQTQDMSQVPAPGEIVDEGWFHVRVSKVEETDSKQGHPMINLFLKIQSEGAMLGRVIFDNASLQPQALFKLKGYYKAINYNPGPEGHDPDKLLDSECYVYVEHEIYEGVKRAKVPPWSIRSITEGPGKSTPKK